MIAFAHSPAPMPLLSERTTTDLICALEDERALLDEEDPRVRFRAVVRCMMIRHILWTRDVDTPDLHPLENRAAFRDLPQDLADVDKPAARALDVILSHGGSLVEG